MERQTVLPSAISQPTLIVHGGAWDIPDDQVDAHLAGCRRACEVGWKLLRGGASALDAVEASVRVMEDDPTFDAGRGSHLNAAGQIELDALIMDGATLSAGSVAAVQRVRNPISLARLVMEKSEHVMLVAKGAERFAREHGLPVCEPEDLLVGRELERWRIAQGNPDRLISQAFGTIYRDTVGAVARDAQGNIAAATSTGGTPNKLPGRVGDSPLIGCGAYADDRSGGVSATGHGEALMKVVMSKTTCDFIARGLDAQHAAEAAVQVLAERVKGLGGVIVVDMAGRIGAAHNTPRMAHAYATSEGEIVARIQCD
ncbi:MAG: Asparaginase [Chloroflexi bacterium]|nr:Asparaginase [Chloroflexota bacterium]